MGIKKPFVELKNPKPFPRKPPERPDYVAQLEPEYSDWVVEQHVLRDGEDSAKIPTEKNRELDPMTWVVAVPIYVDAEAQQFKVILSAEFTELFTNVCANAKRVWLARSLKSLNSEAPTLVWENGERVKKPEVKGRCQKCGALTPMSNPKCRFRGCGGELKVVQ